MKLARALVDGNVVSVRIEGERATVIDDVLAPSPRTDGATIDLARAKLLTPVSPSKIVCVGRNYRAHARELGSDVPTEPLLFLKPPSALIAHGDAIALNRFSQRVEHEGELAVIIGRRAHDIARDDAHSYIAGYTCANDVTARDLQRRDVQFTRAKSFDTFCPLGPWMVTETPDFTAEIMVRVKGNLRQKGLLGDMVFPIDHLVAYISAVMTLEPGDVILTGTPEGVGPLAQGDRVSVSIDGVGILENGVIGPVHGARDERDGTPNAARG